VCTRLLVIEGSTVEAHLGNYSDWRRRNKALAAAPPQPRAPAKSPAKSPVKALSKPEAPPPTAIAQSRTAGKDRDRELRRLARRVETLEADVGKLEAELATVRAALGGDHAGDWQKLHQLADRERELDASLARRIAEWESASQALLQA